MKAFLTWRCNKIEKLIFTHMKLISIPYRKRNIKKTYCVITRNLLRGEEPLDRSFRPVLKKRLMMATCGSPIFPVTYIRPLIELFSSS